MLLCRFAILAAMGSGLALLSSTDALAFCAEVQALMEGRPLSTAHYKIVRTPSSRFRRLARSGGGGCFSSGGWTCCANESICTPTPPK
jgi:hypothetical protein